MSSILDQWSNLNTHVDTSIESDNFVNSAHTVIYARLNHSSSTAFYPIGVVQGFTFVEQRQVDEIFEVGSDARYIIPGRTSGQLSIQRILIHGADLINTLYGTLGANSTLIPNTIKSLRSINSPLDLLFVTYDSSDSNSENMARYFTNCWITSRQESINANQVVIAEQCSLIYENVDTTIVNTSDV